MWLKQWRPRGSLDTSSSLVPKLTVSALRWPQREKKSITVNNKQGVLKMAGRPKNAVGNVLIKAWVNPELKGKMFFHLVSEVEGRIPQGKISEFISGLMRDYFGWEQISLEAYGFPAGYFVKGPPAMIAALRLRLAEQQS